MPNTELLTAVQTYFDALFTCDLALFDKVFDNNCSLFDADEGVIAVEPIAQYRNVIADRIPPSSKGQKREDEIMMIDWLSDVSALVKVRLRIHQKVFLDHLCFVKGIEGWRIVAKIWHLESFKDSAL